MGPLESAALFLVKNLFDIYLFILILRFLSQYFRVDYYNPLSQFVVRATNSLVVPLRRFIPGYWGMDLATVCVVFLVTLVKLILVSLISAHQFPHFFGLLIWSLGEITTLTIRLFFYIILLNVILSWVAPTSYSPVGVVLQQISDPLMRPARRFIPSMGGFDITPMVVIIALELLSILIAHPLTQVGVHFAIR